MLDPLHFPPTPPHFIISWWPRSICHHPMFSDGAITDPLGSVSTFPFSLLSSGLPLITGSPQKRLLLQLCSPSFVKHSINWQTCSSIFQSLKNAPGTPETPLCLQKVRLQKLSPTSLISFMLQSIVTPLVRPLDFLLLVLLVIPKSSKPVCPFLSSSCWNSETLERETAPSFFKHGPPVASVSVQSWLSSHFSDAPSLFPPWASRPVLNLYRRFLRNGEQALFTYLSVLFLDGPSIPKGWRPYPYWQLPDSHTQFRHLCFLPPVAYSRCIWISHGIYNAPWHKVNSSWPPETCPQSFLFQLILPPIQMSKANTWASF